MNRLGVHALVWAGGWSEAECSRAIRSTAELGYDFLEIPLLNPYGFPVDFTRARLEEHRLGATASLGLSEATDISSEDPETVKRGEDLLNTAVAVVRDLGATHFCGVIHSALKKYPQPRTERGVANVVEVLRRVAEKAHASSITVGVEVVNRYETNIVNTGAECVALMDRIGQPNVFAHLDTYHMNIEEGFVGKAIEDCGDRLGYFHIGESHRGYLGTGTVNFTEVFRSLARIGYEGPIAFEILLLGRGRPGAFQHAGRLAQPLVRQLRPRPSRQGVHGGAASGGEARDGGRSMTSSVATPDWSSIPSPEDDGAARHLPGAAVPSVALPATDGATVDLSRLRGRTVVYAYPRTGVPGVENPDGWDLIPGARGCTPKPARFVTTMPS